MALATFTAWGQSSEAAPPLIKLGAARKLAVMAAPGEVRSPSVTIELDDERNRCAIYHVYRTSGSEPHMLKVTIGWWFVDLRTGDVWDQNSKYATNRQIDALQRSIRKHLAVTADEIAWSRSSPCDARYAIQ
jgi:hypothetical protein